MKHLNFGKCHICLVCAIASVVLLGIIAILSTAHAEEVYCSSLEDYLNYRPYLISAVVEDRVLQWGREQGIPGLDSPITPDRRNAALKSVLKLISKNYLGSVSLPDKAPDAGVRVRIGKPHVVMFGPEGKVADPEKSSKKLGYDRWGCYMWPTVYRLRDDRILVRIFTGGEDPRYPRPLEWLNYVSSDGGRSWLQFASFDKYLDETGHKSLGRNYKLIERPATEAAFQLDNGEEIRYGSRVIRIDGIEISPRVGKYYRLGDLPREMRWVPLFTRKPGIETWTEEKAYYDAPDVLLPGIETEVKDGDATIKVRAVNLTEPCTTDRVAWIGSRMSPCSDGSLISWTFRNTRLLSEITAEGTLGPDASCYIWRSRDRGRTWSQVGTVPHIKSGPWFPDRSYVNLEAGFSDGSWVAFLKTSGIFCSGGGPLFIFRSTNEGKTWSTPKPIRPSSCNPTGLLLKNGIAVRAYGRPGVFLTFCGDGKGDKWGNDVTLIKPWKTQQEENSCCNGNFAATGPDRFVYVYSKWDVPDPWGQPRQAVIAQEFVVSNK